MISRGAFIGGTAFVLGTPVLAGLHARAEAAAISYDAPALKIAGWDDIGEDAGDAVWIVLDRSWRSAWRG